MIDFFKHCAASKNNKIIFILSLIAISMIIDFLTGYISAKINTNIIFESEKDIKWILRKISSMIVMIFLIPVSFLLPNEIGINLIYFLYLDYLVMEIKSILENLRKMGLDISPFQAFIDKIEKK